MVLWTMLACATLGDVVVYGTFEQPGYGHHMWASGRVGSTSQTQFAVQCQVSQSGYFTEISAPVRMGTGRCANEVKFMVGADVDSLPGEILESMALEGQMTLQKDSLVHRIGEASTFLDAAQTYWTVARADY